MNSARGFTSFRYAYVYLFAGVLLINVVDKLPALLGISVFSAAVELIPGGEKYSPIFIADYY